MKKVYLMFSAAIGFTGLILAFENIMIEVPIMIFFDSMTSSLFWPLMLTLLMGFAAGTFFGLYLTADKKKPETDFGGDLDI